MIKTLQFLLHGCWHNWEHYKTGLLTSEGTPKGNYYIYKCSKCDRIEERNKTF